MAHVGVSIRRPEQIELTSDVDLRLDAEEAMRRTNCDLTTVLVETLRWALTCLSEAEFLAMNGRTDNRRVVDYIAREEQVKTELGLRRRRG
jgi:hypothetical protein